MFMFMNLYKCYEPLSDNFWQIRTGRSYLYNMEIKVHYAKLRGKVYTNTY